MTVYLDGETLKIEDVVSVSRYGEKVDLKKEAIEKIKKSHEVLMRYVQENRPIYGVTTGIGELAKVRISPELSKELQKRIIFSHSAGAGKPLPKDVVKAAMLLRANVLAKGYSGVREDLVRFLIEMINRDVVPLVYEKGSVGTSGDLSPLSQIGEVIMGYGKAYYKDKLLPGGEALEKAGLSPMELTYKEGLGIINGTQMMTGELALLLKDSELLIKNALIASGMSIDALRSLEAAFDPLVHKVRNFTGQQRVAEAIKKLIEGSQIIADKSGKVQDGYSIRCTPQIMGPTIDTLIYARTQVEIEMNSAVDNPLFFPEEGEYRAGGNFHGQNIGFIADFMGIAISELGNLSERHINRLLNPVLSNGLPDFLVEGKGINSGFMVAQYTAASLVSENKVLAHPASVDSISVSADQEDHVSMGPIAVRKLRQIIENVITIIAIEMMCGAQAFDLRKPKKPGRGTSIAYNVIREKVEYLEEDRPLHEDIKAIEELIKSGKIVEEVEKEVGELKVV